MYRIISFFNTSVASVERLCGQLHSKRVARTSRFVRFVYRERFVRFEDPKATKVSQNFDIKDEQRFLKLRNLRSNSKLFEL